MSYCISSNELGAKILAAIGYDGECVTSVELMCQAGEAAQIIIQRLVTDEEGEAIRSIVSRLVMEDQPEEVEE
jgi:hypothetical protein